MRARRVREALKEDNAKMRKLGENLGQREALIDTRDDMNARELERPRANIALVAVTADRLGRDFDEPRHVVAKPQGLEPALKENVLKL